MAESEKVPLGGKRRFLLGAEVLSVYHPCSRQENQRPWLGRSGVQAQSKSSLGMLISLIPWDFWNMQPKINTICELKHDSSLFLPNLEKTPQLIIFSLRSAVPDRCSALSPYLLLPGPCGLLGSEQVAFIRTGNWALPIPQEVQRTSGETEWARTGKKGDMTQVTLSFYKNKPQTLGSRPCQPQSYVVICKNKPLTSLYGSISQALIPRKLLNVTCISYNPRQEGGPQRGKESIQKQEEVPDSAHLFFQAEKPLWALALVCCTYPEHWPAFKGGKQEFLDKKHGQNRRIMYIKSPGPKSPT